MHSWRHLPSASVGVEVWPITVGGGKFDSATRVIVDEVVAIQLTGRSTEGQSVSKKHFLY